MKLRAKLTLAYMLLVAIPLVLAFVVFSTELRAQVSQNIENEQIETFSQIKFAIENVIEEYQKDIVLLSNLSSLQSYLDTGGVQYLNAAKSDFYSFTIQNELYSQIRYIDENGQEVVRINNNNGDVEIVPPQQLQDKSDRYYFIDAIKAKKGVVYVSPLDLNIENGEIENVGTDDEPIYVPMLRIATPVFNKNGDRKGIVIINRITDFDHISKTISPTQLRFTVLNSDGYYLESSEESKEWGFMLNNNENYFNEYPMHEQRFQEYSTVNKYVDYDIGKTLYFDFIYPSGSVDYNMSEQYESTISVPQGIHYYWIVISSLENDVFSSSFTGIVLKYFAFVLAVIVVLLCIIHYGMGFVINPVIHIAEAATAISKGDLLEVAGMERTDELGELARSMNAMVKKLQLNQSIIQKEVDERTKDLEEMNKHLVGREIKMDELKRRIRDLEKSN